MQRAERVPTLEGAHNGNFLSTTTPSPDGVLPGSTTSFTYDNQGQILTITDPLNHQTTMTYYPTGLIHTITDAQNNTTTYAYDTPENGATQYTYDTLNRLTKLQDFQSHNFGFSYDQLSRRTQLTRPNGVNTNYSYDNLSRLLSVLHQVGVTTLDGASYTYDSAGNRTSKTDPAGQRGLELQL